MVRLAVMVAIPMEHKMELELIDAILHSIYPTHNGWKRLLGCQLDEVDVDYVFFRKGELPVAALIMESPYVNREDLKLVQHLKQVYNQKMNGRQLHVMLVYQELLIRPQRMPKGMSVLSLSEVANRELVGIVN
jgi:hypothetical protein